MQPSPPVRAGSAPPQYVYTVYSRRTGGLSLGVDLVPNHACNFRCVYCDVEDLVDRDGQELDLAQLEAELTEALEVLRERGEVLRSVCLSGRGEPTKQFEFPAAIEVIAKVCKGRVPRFALLTNGAELTGKRVRAGLATWAGLGGEIWFKLDSATREGQREINSSDILLRLVRNSLRVASETCPTWIQTMLFTRRGEQMSAVERKAYLDFLTDQKRSGLRLEGVQLCSIDRPSAQPEAQSQAIGPADGAFVSALAAEVRAIGLNCVEC